MLQGRYKRLEQPIYGSLTRREKEVLTLMCRGYSQDQIAYTLNVTNEQSSSTNKRFMPS